MMDCRCGTSRPDAVSHAKRRVGLVAFAFLLSLALAQARSVAAQRSEAVGAWSIASLELSAGLAVSYATIAKKGGEAPIIVAPVAISALIGYLSYRQQWDPVIPLAAHGALWSGLDLFLLTGLIQGAIEDRSFAAGPLAYGLAGLGALAGAWVGASKVDSTDKMKWWLGALTLPTLSAVVLAGVGSVAFGARWSGSKRERFIGWSTAAVLSGGLLVGYGAALRDGDSRETPGSSYSLSFGTRPITLAWCGSF
ncbi:MAG: hypothetical protein V2A73_13855 [Pseudomonadota bacterium]